MKKSTKVLLTVACAILLVCAGVFGTLAFLTSTDKVTNTFTVGEVAITLDEEKVDEYGVVDETATSRVDTNEYKLIPGHQYIKDPTIHVDADSEDCWVFTKVENGLGDDAEITMTTGWSLVDGETDVYAYQIILSAGQNVNVFSTFTFDEDADPMDHVTVDTDGKVTDSDEIVITGYAVQADGFDTAAAAWAATFGTPETSSAAGE